jgi:hypothetical protein
LPDTLVLSSQPKVQLLNLILWRGFIAFIEPKLAL